MVGCERDDQRSCDGSVVIEELYWMEEGTVQPKMGPEAGLHHDEDHKINACS